jgi:hypothetical protein
MAKCKFMKIIRALVYFVSHKIVYTYDFAPLQSRLWNTLKIWPGMPGRYKQFARRVRQTPPGVLGGTTN